jgi:hypothetical protein
MPVYIFNTFDDPSASLPPTTWGRGVNDMDQIVGFYIDATGFHGFLESGPLAAHGPDPNTGGAPLQRASTIRARRRGLP